MRRLFQGFSLVLCVWLAQAALAQGTPPPGGVSAEALQKAMEAIERGDPTEPTQIELTGLDASGREALAASLEAYYRYRESAFHHRRAVFDWQLISSRIIFFVTIALVGIGIYFSWLQFMSSPASGRKESEKDPEAGEKGRGGMTTTLEATLQGVKVSSPVLGVIILVISLAFFYLYLTHVYPIVETF